MTTTQTHTKEQVTDAAVEEVRRMVQNVLDGGEDTFQRIYIEAYQVTMPLVESGVITHEHLSSSTAQWRDQARASLDGKVKRLLDAECARPNPRLVRRSSVKDGPMPQLDGTMRTLYSNGVGYTTPEAYELAVRAVDAERERLRARAELAKQLMDRAESSGMPLPGERHTTFTYGLERFEELVEFVEELSR